MYRATANIQNVITFSDKEKPLYFINAAAVSKEGNIIYQIHEYGSIQVYDGEQSFLYRIGIPAQAQWMLDDENMLHIIYSHNNKNHHVIIEGEKIISDVFMEQEEFDALYHNLFMEYNKPQYTTNDGHRYIVKGRTIEKCDESGKLLEKIHPPIGPILPPPAAFFWFVSAICMCIVFGITDIVFEKMKSWVDKVKKHRKHPRALHNIQWKVINALGQTSKW